VANSGLQHYLDCSFRGAPFLWAEDFPAALAVMSVLPEPACGSQAGPSARSRETFPGADAGDVSQKLKLAPADNNAPYLAVYYSISDLAGGLAIVAGGHLYDRLAGGGFEVLSIYTQLFVWAWVARTSAAYS